MSLSDTQHMSRNYNSPSQYKGLEELSLGSNLRGIIELNETKETEYRNEENENGLYNKTPASQSRLKSINEKSFDQESEMDESYINTMQSMDVGSKLLNENYEVVDMTGDAGASLLLTDKRSGESREEIDSTMSSVISPEEMSPTRQNRIFYIKNIDTGDVYDIRDGDEYKKISKDIHPSPNNIILQTAPWKAFWKKVRANNELLWDYCELGEADKVRNLLGGSQSDNYDVQVDSRGLDDMTALHLAANEGHAETVKILLRFDADIEAKTKMGRTPLHIAVLRGNYSIVKLLISAGADINVIDNEFSTPLHYASEHGHTKIIEELLSARPEVTKKNHAGLTALDVALNSETWRTFEKWDLANSSMLCSFGRTCIGNFLIYNSRADYVSKILFMHNRLYRQKNGQVPKPVCGTSDDSKNVKRKDSRDHFIRPKSVISKIIIHCNSLKSQAPSLTDHFTFPAESSERIGPQSFICHATLGKGSFGEVFLVEKITSKKLFAMKVLRKEKILSQNLTRYAQTERNVLSIMNHPFIVKLSYAFQTDTRLYLLLDYCPGGDLGAMLTRKKRLTEDVARIYAAEITLALEALHKTHIIFRDLKPDNVVIDSDGHAQITDFGLSKEGVNNNLSKSFCGSVAYLAPEMLRRSGHNRTVDWYLLGVLIYEMLVGVPPYFSSNRDELFDNIQKAQLKLPRTMTDDAKSLIKNLLNRNPQKRLGADNDADDIKGHPWFKSINWKHALERKLQPPKPTLKRYSIDGVKIKLEDTDDKAQSKEHIPNWSFAVKDESMINAGC